MCTLYLKLPYQSLFVIMTNCEKIVKKLSLKYGFYISPKKVKGNNCQKIYVIKNDSSYTISTTNSIDNVEKPIEYIDQYIHKYNKFSEKIFALHGAAVEWKGCASLFLAPTSSGKTTLTTFLTNHGCGYLTDDCVLVDRSNFNICPQSTPIQLREGGYRLLEEMGEVPPNICVLDEPPLRRLTYTPSYCIKHPIPLNKIYFIQRNESINKTMPMSSVEKIEELIKSPIIEYPIGFEYIKFISRLAQIECLRMLYKDFDYVEKIIQS